jgi:predicted ATP-dependent serine protease
MIKDRVPFHTDVAAWENVKADLAELNAKPALIVIDTLSRLMVGMDENVAKDATQITTFMEQLARYYECFVLAIHHTGKDENKGARGSSAFHANMDTVLATKTKPGGTEFRVKKQKDADVADEIHYFAIKEVGQSIVLERGTAPADDPNTKKQSSRYAWASSEEVVKALQTLGGSTSDTVLEFHIASALGIDKDVVRKQLQGNDELTWLRPTQGQWAIPSQEFDL